MTNNERRLIALTYLAHNGKLTSTSKSLNLDATTVARALAQSGILTSTQCPGYCCTASQSRGVIDAAFEFAAEMTDQKKAQDLIDKVRHHHEVGTARLIDGGKLESKKKWIPKKMPDGRYWWWEHLNGDLEEYELSRQEMTECN